MTKAKQWLGYIGGLLILAAAFWVSRFIVATFIEASATVRLGVLTAAISVITILYNNSRQQSREIRSRQFIEKRDAYRKYFDFLFEIFHSGSTSTPIPEEDLIRKTRDLMKDLMIWGSPQTINQYNKFMRDSIFPADNLADQFQRVENLLREFRRDLGHDDRKLEHLGLSKLLIKAEEHHKIDEL